MSREKEDLFRRSARVSLYVSGALSDLSDAGLLADCGVHLGASSVWRYDQLRASGWRPTRREIERYLAALEKHCGQSFEEGVAGLVERLDDVLARVGPSCE